MILVDVAYKTSKFHALRVSVLLRVRLFIDLRDRVFVDRF
jgi:hypothetical protein